MGPGHNALIIVFAENMPGEYMEGEGRPQTPVSFNNGSWLYKDFFVASQYYIVKLAFCEIDIYMSAK